MRFDRAEVALRPRGGLEAVDLGLALARRAWRPLAASWLVWVLPLAAALILALRDHPLVAVVLLWWLRPIFARVPLFVLAREVFGDRSRSVDVARALPGLLRGGWLASLGFRRLSPARAMALPVQQLEGLRGTALRERSAILTQRDLGTCMGLVAVMAHLNVALVLGLALGAVLALPEAVTHDAFELWASLGDGRGSDPRWMLLPALYFAGSSLVEPLLCAGGFGLYLNRRVLLEGWDLDLAFRRLARRHGASARAAAGLFVALALCAGLPARAEPEACEPARIESVRDCFEGIATDGVFGGSEERLRWTLRDDLFDFGDDDDDWAGLAWLAQWIAAAGELLLWLLLAVAAIALGIALAGHRSGTPQAPEAAAPPTRVFGLELDRGSLPDDVPAAARAAWRRGERALALSLLYRGALVALVDGAGLRIPVSATELECIGMVREARPRAAGTFETLTRAWLRARYADAPPGDEVFEAICEGFEGAFGEPA